MATEIKNNFIFAWFDLWVWCFYKGVCKGLMNNNFMFEVGERKVTNTQNFVKKI